MRAEMNCPYAISLTIIAVCTAIATLFLITKIKTIMASFEEMQATIAATNTALTNISDEMGAMQNEIDALKEQIGNMGLTAEQESTIADGLQSLRTRAENISTVIEGAPAEEPTPDPEQPEEPNEETPA
jgi:septal ring factor EnvC (AmiA/AmiB activator)